MSAFHSNCEEHMTIYIGITISERHPMHVSKLSLNLVKVWEDVEEHMEGVAAKALERSSFPKSSLEASVFDMAPNYSLSQSINAFPFVHQSQNI